MLVKLNACSSTDRCPRQPSRLASLVCTQMFNIHNLYVYLFELCALQFHRKMSTGAPIVGQLALSLLTCYEEVIAIAKWLAFRESHPQNSISGQDQIWTNHRRHFWFRFSLALIWPKHLWQRLQHWVFMGMMLQAWHTCIWEVSFIIFTPILWDPIGN